MSNLRIATHDEAMHMVKIFVDKHRYGTFSTYYSFSRMGRSVATQRTLHRDLVPRHMPAPPQTGPRWHHSIRLPARCALTSRKRLTETYRGCAHNLDTDNGPDLRKRLWLSRTSSQDASIVLKNSQKYHRDSGKLDIARPYPHKLTS